jgi:hypothetical protein
MTERFKRTSSLAVLLIAGITCFAGSITICVQQIRASADRVWPGFMFTQETYPSAPLALINSLAPVTPALLSGARRETWPGVGPGIITYVAPATPASWSGIRTGDIVVQVNGIRLHENPRDRQMERVRQQAAAARYGDTAVYLISRKAEIRRIAMRLASPLVSALRIGMGAGVLAALLFVATGFIVLAKKHDHSHARVFFLMCMLLAGLVLLWHSLVLPRTNALGLAEAPMTRSVAMFVSFSETAALVLLLHFALVFPFRRPALTAFPHLLRWVYAVPVLALVSAFLLAHSLQLSFRSNAAVTPWVSLLLLLYAALLAYPSRRALQAFRARRDDQITWAEAAWRARAAIAVVAVSLPAIGFLLSILLADWLHSTRLVVTTHLVARRVVEMLFSTVLLVYPFLAGLVAVRSYREGSLEEKRQLKWPAWGISAFAILLTASAGSRLAQFSLAQVNLSAVGAIAISVLGTLSFLVLPVAFAAAILKYRLMDIDLM